MTLTRRSAAIRADTNDDNDFHDSEAGGIITLRTIDY
jgi:hypothetical protein